MTQRTKIAQLLASKEADTTVLAKGWVRTKRGNKAVSFIALNDGSTVNNIQIITDPNLFDEEVLKNITIGACISVEGLLVESPASGQGVEMQASKIELLAATNWELHARQSLPQREARYWSKPTTGIRSPKS